jgi:hypothetical protein
MGRLQADEMAVLADIDQALTWHLTSNHYPPVPIDMVPVCRQAIEAQNDGDWDCLIELPEGTYYRGRSYAPAWAIVEAHHLESWVG